MQKIIKTPGPEYVNGPMRGHCYDGPGWNKCSFWLQGDGPENSCCTLFGGPSGVKKYGSESLRICDRIFGVEFEGEV